MALDMSDEEIVGGVVRFEVVEDVSRAVVVHCAVKAILKNVVHGDGLCVFVEHRIAMYFNFFRGMLLIDASVLRSLKEIRPFLYTNLDMLIGFLLKLNFLEFLETVL